MLRNLFVVFVLAAATASPAFSAGEHDTLRKGPPVGAKIPHSLAIPDQNNQHRDFKSLARKRGLILMFSRSLDW